MGFPGETRFLARRKRATVLMASLAEQVALLPSGSRGREAEDAQSFAAWDVDFLKYDNCWAPPSDWVVDRYTAMRDALNATGRPILYSMCDWGVGDPWLWADEVRPTLSFLPTVLPRGGRAAADPWRA